MNDQLIRRVKNSLNAQFYSMNDLWLSDCIEYYLEDHQNSTHNEIITFVINQWVLCDLREINNENGCLPKNLASKKCTTLSGKYILQMDKLYDISQSKYKQLEKIRNVSFENVEATEKENKQTDIVQGWETKAKRMLQLFLTDGIQDVLAIEYKPIRFLKDSLYPGFKLLIKGPVICRKGVILLEEANIAEVGGEVDSLLVMNAVENIFARTLNLNENPDPYNDNKDKVQNVQTSENATKIEDEFDINEDVIDQIDKQFQQQNSIETNTSESRNKRRPKNVTNNQTPNSGFNNQNKKYSSQTKSQNSSATHTHKTQKQNLSSCVQSTGNNFEDEDDLFFNMVDDKALENISSSKPIPTIQKSSMSSTTSSSSRIIQNINVDDFPINDEMYDLNIEQSPYFSATKVQVRKPASTSSMRSYPEKSQNKQFKQPDLVLKDKCKDTVSNTSKETVTSSKFNYPSTSNYNISKNKQFSSSLRKIESLSNVNASEFPDDDFNMDDFDINMDNYSNPISKQSSSSLRKIESTSSVNASEFPDDDFNMDDFDINMDNYSNPISKQSSSSLRKIESTSSVNKQVPVNNYKKKEDTVSSEYSGVKRLASRTSPINTAPQKIRCLQSTPKDKSCNRKITDFWSKPSSKPQSQERNSSTQTSQEIQSSASKSQQSSSITLLDDNVVRICEFIKDVLKESLKGEKIHTVVRGKVANIVKLNLLKDNKEHYFHLEGIITDNTGNLDVVFSSQVLAELIGYSPQAFVQKRKMSKSNPAVKEELKEDLKKAQDKLRVLDVLMEIKYKINERAEIVKIMKLSKDERKYLDLRTNLSKSQ